MPQTPEERRKTFEALSAKRQEMLARERERIESRERESVERTARQKEASLTEQGAAAARSEEREEWRQHEHEKKEELLADARKAAEERARQAEKKAKEEAEKRERTEKIRELHDRAVTQKVASRKLQARHIEEDTAKHVDDQLERDIRDADRVMERTLEHLSQDRKKKIAVLEDDAGRQSIAMAERYAARKKEALASGPRGGSDVYRVTSEHKRAIMTLEARAAEARVKIESEYARLKDEAVAQGEQKKARLRSAADQRLREAKTRHENTDDWIDSHRN